MPTSEQTNEWPSTLRVDSLIILLTVHRGAEQPRIQTEVHGHLLVRSLIRSHRSLVELAPSCSLRSRAPLRSLARSLSHSVARGTVID